MSAWQHIRYFLLVVSIAGIVISAWFLLRLLVFISGVWP